MGNAIRTIHGIGLVTCVAALAACGGGGGGGSPSTPESLLSGSYVYLYLDRDVAGDSVYSEVATFTANGGGGIVFDPGWQTGEGGPETAIRRANAIYDVTADRGLTVAGGFPSQLLGAVSSGGTYATAPALSAGQDPGWFCAARRDTSPSIAEVVGSWRFVEWVRTGPTPDDAASIFGRVTVDGAGNVSHSEVHYNEDGAIDPVAIAFVSSHFEIGGPGGLRMIALGLPRMDGGMSTNGDVVLLGARGAGSAGVRIMVREDRVTGAGGVQGTWGLTGFAAARPGYACMRGEATFDGVADGTWSANANLDGTPGVGAVIGTDYVVGSQGQLGVLWPGSAAYHGGAVPGFAVLGGPLTPARDPCLYTLIR